MLPLSQSVNPVAKQQGRINDDNYRNWAGQSVISLITKLDSPVSTYNKISLSIHTHQLINGWRICRAQLLSKNYLTKSAICNN